MRSCLFALSCAIYMLSCQSAAQPTIKSGSPGKDTLLKVLVYGLQNVERQNAETVIARKYGFVFHAVAGCIVYEELVDSVKKENEKTYAVIETKYGKNFWERFEKEVDTEYRKQERVKRLLAKQPYLKSLEKQLQQSNNGIYYFLQPTGKSNEYDVTVYGWGAYQNEMMLVVFYELKANHQTGKVTVLSKTVKPF